MAYIPKLLTLAHSPDPGTSQMTAKHLAVLCDFKVETLFYSCMPLINPVFTTLITQDPKFCMCVTQTQDKDRSCSVQFKNHIISLELHPTKQTLSGYRFIVDRKNLLHLQI